MSEVYLARDTKLDRDVAVNVLSHTWPPIRAVGCADRRGRANVSRLR